MQGRYQWREPGRWPRWGNDDLTFGYYGVLNMNSDCDQGTVYEGVPKEACGGHYNWGATEMEVWYRVGT